MRQVNRSYSRFALVALGLLLALSPAVARADDPADCRVREERARAELAHRQNEAREGFHAEQNAAADAFDAEQRAAEAQFDAEQSAAKANFGSANNKDKDKEKGKDAEAAFDQAQRAAKKAFADAQKAAKDAFEAEQKQARNSFEARQKEERDAFKVDCQTGSGSAETADEATPREKPAEETAVDATPRESPAEHAAIEAKADSGLAAVAAEAAPTAPLQVIVFGRGADEARKKLRLRGRRELALVGAESLTVTAKDLGKLAAQKGVTYVAADLPVLPTSGADLPVSRPLAALFPQLDGAPAAWARGLTGKGVGIAVIDSGVAPGVDFGRRLVQVRLPGPGPGTGDAYGHGTFVAGAAAGSSPDGRYAGIAPESTVYAVNVSRRDGVYTSDVIAGLGWVRANHRRLGIRVVSLSLTEASPSSYRTSVLDTAVEELWRQGVVVVVSAGNLGPDSVVFAPANDPLVITVGAVDHNGTSESADDAEAHFSSRGKTLEGIAKPELLAPGRRIASVLPRASRLGREAPAANLVEARYATMSGTSFAAPQVAGAAAVLLQQHPRWTPDEVKCALVLSARGVAGSTAGALDLARASAAPSIPCRRQQTRPARFGAKGSPTVAFRRANAQAGRRDAEDEWGAPNWNASSWNASSWNASSWNASSWNASSWNASSWNASSWNASSWNGSGWE
jgi:serine protease AprX